MASKTTAPLPPRVEKVRQRFERWRAQRKSTTERIPEPLWAAAAKVATKFGVHRTARALRLECMKLKQRVESTPTNAAAAALEQRASFVELAVATTSKLPSCALELESPSGMKLRLEFADVDTVALATVVRSLLDAPR